MDREHYVHETHGANRDDWEFGYSAQKVAEAATEQRDYRLERVKVWEGEKAKVMAKIKESGLTVHEPVAEKMSAMSSSNYVNSLHNEATVLVDHTLQKDLTECTKKIRHHRELAQEYDAWVQVLSANPTQHLNLRHADWMFFFGK